MGQHNFGDESRWKDTSSIQLEEDLNSVFDKEKDEGIHQEIVQGLIRSGLNTQGVTVIVINAVVFLRGLVDSFEDFIKIEEFVGHIPGVEDIKNELQVKA